MSFLAGSPAFALDTPREVAAVAAKTLTVSAAITQNPSGAPTPQQIIVAVSQALSDPAFGTTAPWSATITVSSS